MNRFNKTTTMKESELRLIIREELKNRNPYLNNVEENEIDLIKIARKLWNKRKLILWITAIFAIIGLFVAISSPAVFTTNTIFIGKYGSMEEMKNITGYQLTFQSVKFRMALVQMPIHFEGQEKPVSLLEYYMDEDRRVSFLSVVKKYSIGLPGTIRHGLKRAEIAEEQASVVLHNNDNGAIRVTEKMHTVLQMIASNVSIHFNEKEGYLTISASMPEAHASADLAQNTATLLQETITSLIIDQIQENFIFIQKRYAENKTTFEKARDSLDLFFEQNLSVISPLVKRKEERLNEEYTLASELFYETQIQLREIELMVNTETPVFSTINPVAVPLERSSPKRKKILMIYTFIGAIIGVGWVFGMEFIQKSKEKWYSEEG